MRKVNSLHLCVLLMKTCAMALQCKIIKSVNGKYLRQRVISTHPAEGPVHCPTICAKYLNCKSWNYWLDDKKCELNDADRFTQPKDYQDGIRVIYSDTPDSAPSANCADVKERDPGAQSGYYWIHIRKKMVQVFCDMDNYGGGWTLVGSISSQNNDHLQRAENNCFNSELCVPFANVTIPARKFSDEDIHKIALSEGTFRVEDWWTTPVNTAFYKIPSGVDYFNSSCNSVSCPRIIISYSFPYLWESNCKGTELGYKISSGACYAVFDGHDSQECQATMWHSSKYHPRRILYGFLPPCKSNGLYKDHQGLLFVK